MVKSIFINACLLAVVLVSGCASVPMASPEADAVAKTFRGGAEQANLYIYRNESFGAAVKMSVFLDGTFVGDTAAKTYIFKQISPGNHVITSKAENNASLSIDAIAGKNYFVWQEVKLGFVSARSDLKLVDEAAGQAGVQECQLIQ